MSRVLPFIKVFGLPKLYPALTWHSESASRVGRHVTNLSQEPLGTDNLKEEKKSLKQLSRYKRV